VLQKYHIAILGHARFVATRLISAHDFGEYSR
jgi:hypothetical protein